MLGMLSYGAYIPYHRMSRAEISRAWGGFAMPGEKAVASYDEDSLTMGVEAAIDCMRGADKKGVDALFFATTTAPFKERLGSAIIAMALDLPEGIRTVDFTGTLRAGTTALKCALDAVKAGSAKKVLVVAAEARLGAPGGDFEQTLGDGAAAVLVGEGDVIAEVKDSHHISDEFSGVWRAEGDAFVRSWEDRMVLDKGYSRVLPLAMGGLMKKSKLAAGDFTRVVYDAPTDVRRHGQVAVQLGFDKGQVQDHMTGTVGNTGSAMALMLLVAALEGARAGDRLLLGSYGNGADAYILEVTKGIEKPGERRGVKKHLASKRMVKNYETYIRWRGLIFMEPAKRPGRPPTSISELFRDRKSILSLYGLKCKKCGTPQYEVRPGRVCVACQAKDQFEPYLFADKNAKIFTFTQDRLADSADPPNTVAVVDFEGGGRSVFDVTDRDPDTIKVEMVVEMTFRKLYSDIPRGIHNYYWKTRPVRC